LTRGLTGRKIGLDLPLRIRGPKRKAIRAPGDFGQRTLPEPLAAAVRKMVKAIGSDSAEDLSQLSDEELMSRYREEGQAAVFTELVHRYERELYRYLARYLGDQTAAEDVFQNTFLQVHLKRGLFENGRPFRPWLYAIATHQAVDALRKSGRHPTVSLDQRINPARSESEAGNLIDLLVSDNVGPLVKLQDSERQQWVRESIARLPDALRQTLILAYHQDLKYREIAEILKIPVGTVKSRLHSALEKLQQMARSAKRGEDE
jgi:RNA polymerase sigma-70 factor, ECF subfamily